MIKSGLKHPKHKKTKIAPQVKKYVAKAIDRNLEDKICVVSGSWGTQSNPWVNQTFHEIGLTNEIKQGSDSKTRSGSNIKIKKIDCIFEFYKEFDHANTVYRGFRPETSLRLFVVNKRIPAGGVADPTQYLTKGTSQTYQSATANEYWMRNYKILYDKKCMFKNSDYLNYLPTADVLYYSIVKTIKKTIKFKKGLTIQYDANTGAIADVVKNYIAFQCVWSGLNDTTSALLPPGLNVSFKIHYEDA